MVVENSCLLHQRKKAQWMLSNVQLVGAIETSIEEKLKRRFYVIATSLVRIQR
jgi:hypothetical protein